MILTKLDQRVSEMMTTAGKKFHTFLWFRFLIIMQNVNMTANGKRNRRLNPAPYMGCLTGWPLLGMLVRAPRLPSPSVATQEVGKWGVQTI